MYAIVKQLTSKTGSGVTEVIIAAAMLVFVIIPVFSTVVEKYVLMEKARVIRDAVDITNISAYNALSAENLGKVQVDINRDEAIEYFKDLLANNLRLDEGLYPGDDSVAEGRVEVLSLVLYQNGFPAVCSEGVAILRPSVHSSICVPIQPSLYRGVILKLLGKDHIDVVVHVDSDIPLNH